VPWLSRVGGLRRGSRRWGARRRGCGIGRREGTWALLALPVAIVQCQVGNLALVVRPEVRPEVRLEEVLLAEVLGVGPLVAVLQQQVAFAAQATVRMLILRV